MTLPTIVVVDDDPEIVRLLRGYLEQVNFRVLTAQNAEVALRVMRENPPTLLILDLMLPDQSGWDIARLVREDSVLARLPIIMLTALVDDTDKIVGLELGADDYITKPFNAREVVARVRAVLRRSPAKEAKVAQHTLKCEDLVMDLDRHEVTLSGMPIKLTPTEYELLEVFLETPGYVFSRSDLLDKLVGSDYEILERTLDSHIKNLRKKLEASHDVYIETVYGEGYCLRGRAA